MTPKTLEYIAVDRLRPVGARPGRPLGILPRIGCGIFETDEIARPCRVDALWVGFEAGVEVLNVSGVAAIEE